MRRAAVVCIYLIKQRPPRVMDALGSQAIGDTGVSSITVSELWYGAAKSKQREANAQALEQVLLPLIVSPFDD